MTDMLRRLGGLTQQFRWRDLDLIGDCFGDGASRHFAAIVPDAYDGQPSAYAPLTVIQFQIIVTAATR
jgi:hypothetical protein